MINSEKMDVLKEHINVYIGQAASLLSEMVNKRINLSVPYINIIKNDKSFCDMVENKDICESIDGHVMSTAINFNDSFSGQAQLVFPTDKIKKLVAICMGEDFIGIEENELENFVDTDYDVIREIGNVILNSVVGGLSNLLGLKLNYSLPQIKIYSDTSTLVEKIDIESSVLLVIHMSFNVSDTDINGIIINMLSLDSINQLEKTLDKIWDDMNG